MTWTNQDFRAYPAKCFSLHREAAIKPHVPINLGAWKSQAAADTEVLLFRKFRFLVRSNPGVDLSLDKLFSENNFRTRRFVNALGDWSVTLTARPNFDTELLRLNPDLARLLPEGCQ
jgi:hypothetical protein